MSYIARMLNKIIEMLYIVICNCRLYTYKKKNEKAI